MGPAAPSFAARRAPLQPAATITGISAMPSCRAASILAWPAIRPPSVQPHSLMLAAIAATRASVWVRAFFVAVHQPNADRLGDEVHPAEGAEDGRAGAGRAAAGEGAARGVSLGRFE